MCCSHVTAAWGYPALLFFLPPLPPCPHLPLLLQFCSAGVVHYSALQLFVTPPKQLLKAEASLASYSLQVAPPCPFRLASRSDRILMVL